MRHRAETKGNRHMMQFRNGPALSLLAAALLLASPALAQDGEHGIEVHYCFHNGAGADPARLGIKASGILGSRFPASGWGVGTVTFPGDEELEQFRETAEDMLAGGISEPGDFASLRPYLHQGAELGNAEFRREHEDASTWAWSEFRYEFPESSEYAGGPSFLVVETRHEFRVSNNEGTLVLEDGNGWSVQSKYHCGTLPNR